MRKRLLIVALAVVSAIAFTGCGAQKNAQKNFISNLQVTTKRAPQQIFYDLNKGVQVTVVPTNPAEEMTKYVHHLSGKPMFTAPTVNYVRSMGFKEMSPSTDYRLFITIKRADLDGWNGTCYMDLEVNLKDSRGKEVFSQGNISATAKDMMYLPNGLTEAYTQALERIDWSRIASLLRVEDLPKDEPQKQVQGYGDTALEQTIIRWDVQSRPQGADVFWRVVSKTPEVKSTNNKYLQTTPYEATKALDIRGLTYQTSGNVRIILRCEKDGYLPQEKEFDVRMVLDQEEISAFFRLVKEE